MGNILVVIEPNNVSLATPPKYENSFTVHDKASSTVNAYKSDWEDFCMWCKERNCRIMPANACDVADYLEDRANNKWRGFSGKDRKETTKSPLKWNSLQRRLSAISKIHANNGVAFERKHPAISKTLSGIKRVLSHTRPEQIIEDRKTPIRTEDVLKMIDALPESLVGIRNKAILLIGFSGAFRRSEIANIKIDHLVFSEEGVTISLLWSKVGPRSVSIPFGRSQDRCPVKALRNWISQLKDIKAGAPVFVGINRHGQLQEKSLSCRAIALIIQSNPHTSNLVELAKHAQLQDPTVEIPNFGGHSLRSGFATSAILNGALEHQVMDQGGWKKSDTMKKYIRETNRWKNNAASSLGL